MNDLMQFLMFKLNDIYLFVHIFHRSIQFLEYFKDIL